MENVGTHANEPIFGDPDTALRRIARSLTKRIASSVKRMQYAQMKSVLSRLSDEQLKAIGIRRSDIPVYARQCIYETE